MPLFKALVIAAAASAGQPAPAEIGPFSSQAQCIEAAKAIASPSAGEIKTQGSTQSILTTYPTPSNVRERNEYQMGIRITCYEVSP
jgi:hypothetical protein